MRHACKYFTSPERERGQQQESAIECVGGGCNFRRETHSRGEAKAEPCTGTSPWGVSLRRDSPECLAPPGLQAPGMAMRSYVASASASHASPPPPTAPAVVETVRCCVRGGGLSARDACRVGVLACCLSFTLHYSCFLLFIFSFLWLACWPAAFVCPGKQE
jgi:hypothetical protein